MPCEPMTDAEYKEAVHLLDVLKRHYRLMSPECLENRMLELTDKALREIHGRRAESSGSPGNPGPGIRSLPLGKSDDS